MDLGPLGLPIFWLQKHVGQSGKNKVNYKIICINKCIHVDYYKELCFEETILIIDSCYAVTTRLK